MQARAMPVALLAAMTASLATSQGAALVQRAGSIRMAWIEYEENARPKYDTLAQYLSRKLAIHVQATGVSNYDYRLAAKRMDRSSPPETRIHVAVFTPYTYVAAERLVPGI